MSIHRKILAGAALLFAATEAFAGSDVSHPADIFIISRDKNHVFRGSHKIYDRMSEGLIEVEYCGYSYWVRYATIAWTQLEVERDYFVRVEFNRGKGWRPICDHPELHVTLKDLGVEEDPRTVIQNDGTTEQRVNRFALIREAFRLHSGEDTAKSYHSD